MGRNNETRRQRLSLEAINPDTGKADLCLWFRHEKIQFIGKRSRGQLKEAAYIVPWILNHPARVYEGLCWDKDEKGARGVGWLCYVGLPQCAFRKNGDERKPYKDEVFLVFVDDTKLVYNWRWEKSRFAQQGLPELYDLRHGNGKRFKGKKL